MSKKEDAIRILEEKVQNLHDENVQLKAGQNTLEEKETELIVKSLEIAKLKTSSDELNQALADIKGMNELFLNRARDTEKELNLAKRNLSELENSNQSLVLEISELRTELNLRSERDQELENLNRSQVEEMLNLRTELNLKLEMEKKLELKLEEMKTLSSSGMEDDPKEKHLVQVWSRLI